MIVVPLKFFPWMLLIAGIVGPFCGEEIVGCAIMAAVGGVWLYLRHLADTRS